MNIDKLTQNIFLQKDISNFQNTQKNLEQSQVKNTKEKTFQKQLLETSKLSNKKIEKLDTTPYNSNFHFSSSKIYPHRSRSAILEEIKNNTDKKKLYDSAIMFESYFIEKVFKEMQKNIPKNAFFYSGLSHDVFEEMLLTERVKNMSENQEFGIAEIIYSQLNN